MDIDKLLIEKDLAAMVDIVELPEGCMPIDGVMVVQYLNEEGETRITFKTTDSYTSHTIGMLQMASWQLMNMSENGHS